LPWPKNMPRKRFSLSMSWNWNIFTVTNIFEHGEFKSEKLPVRRPAVFSQIAFVFSVLRRTKINTRHFEIK
jgi:hypothetical protein